MKTTQGSEPDLTIQEMIPVRIFGEHWTGFTRKGGPVIECTAAAARGNDLLRIEWRAHEPRGDLCAKFVPALEKIAGRLPA